MSNETVILQQTNLYLNVAGRRLTALPDTGTIATLEKLSPESSLVGGLHGTAVHIVSGSRAYRFTVNVIPNSEDDSFLAATIDAITTLGKAVAVSLTYETTNYVSGSVTIETRPTRNFNADTTEMLAYPMIGVFQVAKVGKWTNPPTLTAEEITALMPG